MGIKKIKSEFIFKSNEALLKNEHPFVISAGNSSFLFSDPLVNMEVCGARLSQREALLFGIPGTSSTNPRRAVPKLRMIDTASTPNEEEVCCHSVWKQEKVNLLTQFIYVQIQKIRFVVVKFFWSNSNQFLVILIRSSDLASVFLMGPDYLKIQLAIFFNYSKSEHIPTSKI